MIAAFSRLLTVNLNRKPFVAACAGGTACCRQAGVSAALEGCSAHAAKTGSGQHVECICLFQRAGLHRQGRCRWGRSAQGPPAANQHAEQQRTASAFCCVRAAAAATVAQSSAQPHGSSPGRRPRTACACPAGCTAQALTCARAPPPWAAPSPAGTHRRGCGAPGGGQRSSCSE